MIGLTERQSKLYAAIVAAFAERKRSLSRADVVMASGIKRSSLDDALAPLIRRKFIGINRQGFIVPWTPPHQKVCTAVCDELSVSMDEVRGPSRVSKLVRARRLIATQLRRNHHYMFVDIAKVINRHQSSAEEYLYRERAANRSKRRVERFRAQKAREMRLAA